jgi:hypothetical protein
MEDTAILDTGTDPGAEGTPGEAEGQTDSAASEIPSQETLGEEKGRIRGPDGKFGKESGAAPARALEDIPEDSASWTPEERKKIIKAGKHGLTSEAAYQAKFGGAKTAGPEVDGEGNPIPALAKPGAKQTDKGKPAAPAVGDLSFLKEALPTIDLSKPEGIVKSIKELQAHSTRSIARAQELERFYPEVQAGLVERLQRGPEGLKEIFTQLDVPVPAWLGAAPAAAPGKQPEGTPAGGVEDLLAGLKDDDFVPASAVKGMVGKLVSQAVAAAMSEVNKEFGPLKETHGKIQERIAAEAKVAQVREVRTKAMADAQAHSDIYGKYFPEERLTVPAEKVWEASVGPDGRMLSKPHAEWPKLKAILEHRRTEFLEKGHPAARYKDYLYERLHEHGDFESLVKGREESAKQNLLTAQQRRVQPSLVNKGVNGGPGGLNGLRITSEADVERAYAENPQAVRAWKKKAMGQA